MSQNIYDNEEFFAGYAKLPRSLHGLDGAPEWPALRALLPDLRDLNLLDLGCGYGWFSRWARQQGARHVDAAGRKNWPIDNYLNEGPRSRDWLTRGVVKHHRMLGTVINLLLRLGFSLLQINEWGPTDAQIAAEPELADDRHRPIFVLIAAQR